MSGARNVIFLFSWPLSLRDSERFGLDELRSKGLRVRAFSLCRLLNADAAERFPVKDRLQGDFIEEFSSWRAFDEAVAAAARDSIFVDYVLALAYLDFKHSRTFRILAKHRARYYVVDAEIPSPLPTIAGRIKKAFEIAALGRFASTRALAQLRRITGWWALPRRIFGVPTGRAGAFVRRYDLTPDTIVPSHALDFDAYLRYVRSSADRSSNGTCVFLDEAATHHPDVALVGGQNLEPASYFATMNALFDEVERQTKLRVVIAAHPRSRYEDFPGGFGGREVIKGATPRLIDQSSLVVTHASTAVSFAVLFRKPVILAKTAGMKGVRYGDLVESMAAALGLRPVELDGSEPVRSLRFDPLPSLGSRFDEYRERYVHSPGVPDVTVWERVAAQVFQETL